MPQIRQEFIHASEDNLPNSFLQPDWPHDIPSKCPSCGSEFHPKINLGYGLGKAGRMFKSISHWITLPWAVVVLFFAPALFAAGGNGGAFALGLLFIVPAVIFSVLGSLCDRTRRVRCYPCNYSKDYPAIRR